MCAPIHWDEIDDCEPDDFTIATMPARFAELGDLHAGIDDAVFDIAPLLEWAERDEEGGSSHSWTAIGTVLVSSDRPSPLGRALQTDSTPTSHAKLDPPSDSP